MFARRGINDCEITKYEDRQPVSSTGWRARLVFLGDQLSQRYPVGREQRGDTRLVHLGDDDLADLRIDLAEDAVRLHLLRLIEVVLGGGDVVHRVGLEAVDEPK